MLTPRSHRALDHVTVAVLLVAPFALRLDGAAEVASWVLAGGHLGLTIATRFPVLTAAERPLPFTAHGWVEVAEGVVLVVVPWLVDGFDTAARVFATVLGLLILLMWKLTPYRAGDAAATADPGAAEPPEPPPPPRP